jgi:hypothetical protein
MFTIWNAAVEVPSRLVLCAMPIKSAKSLAREISSDRSRRLGKPVSASEIGLCFVMVVFLD